MDWKELPEPRVGAWWSTPRGAYLVEIQESGSFRVSLTPPGRRAEILAGAVATVEAGRMIAEKHNNINRTKVNRFVGHKDRGAR